MKTSNHDFENPKSINLLTACSKKEAGNSQGNNFEHVEDKELEERDINQVKCTRYL